MLPRPGGLLLVDTAAGGCPSAQHLLRPACTILTARHLLCGGADRFLTAKRRPDTHPPTEDAASLRHACVSFSSALSCLVYSPALTESDRAFPLQCDEAPQERKI